MSTDSKIREKRFGSLVKDRPKISILIPSYNTAHTIAETLDSVLAQTFTDYEIIVANDAAPDTEELKRVLENYYEKIIFIDKEKNQGTSATRNLMIKEARGELIAFLDADDIWFPNYLQEQAEFLEQSGYDMVYADTEFFGVSHQAGESFMAYNPPRGAVTRRMLVEGKAIILPSGTLIRREELLTKGMFDPDVSRTEDFDLWMRLIFQGTRIGYQRKILFKFRLRPGSGSGDSLQRIERCRDIWRVLQKKLPFTKEENTIIERNVAIEDAALLRAKGRLYLHQKDWKAAQRVFSEAKEKAEQIGLPLKHRLKMSGVLLMLRIAPNILRSLFYRFRADEIEYMPND